MKYVRICSVVLGCLLTFSASIATGQDYELTFSQVRKTIDSMQAAYRGIDDYTCTFLKQERVDGELLPQETIFMKFRKPFSIYMKWIKEPHKGQEILYAHGWNNGELKAHPGSFPDITVNLDPNSGLAMRNNRHPVTEAGIGNTIRIVAQDFLTASTHPADNVKYYDRGIKKTNGRPAHCMEGIMPATSDTAYYAHRALICIDNRLHLPVHVKIFDHSDTLLEEYYYTNIKINPGLTDIDFSPDNPHYDF